MPHLRRLPGGRGWSRLHLFRVSSERSALVSGLFHGFFFFLIKLTKHIRVSCLSLSMNTSHKFFSKPMIFSSVIRFILGLCLNYIAQSTVYGNGLRNPIVPHVYVVLIVGQMVWTLSRIFLVNEVYRVGATLQQLAMF